ncbi:hypothetical protein Lepto7375DRAFT_0598 [Leptolyngbya sp. PCC 7375]|nr:hypothetical protein Lepto7375DRAFT_0598 [Leptolyngbya sp. PCC 7375]
MAVRWDCAIQDHLKTVTSITGKMPSRTTTVTETLATAGRFGVTTSNVSNLRIINTGAQPLTGLAIKAYISESDPGGIIIDTDAEFASPASGSAIQHAEQRNSSGERETTAPTTLPAGSQIFFALATQTSYVKGLHSIEILAQTASGQTTTLDVYVGRA